LEGQAASRVPELVPIRYGRMLVSPFAFYRGAAVVMASDLATTPRSGITVQVCGDAHLSNFGAYASPERRLVFDVNDFDETIPGPWEWDVKRLAASFAVAGRDRGFTDKERTQTVLAAVEAYRTEMHSVAEMRHLDVWYRDLDVDRALADLQRLETSSGRRNVKALADATSRTERAATKARTSDGMHEFAKLTTFIDGQPRIVRDPPLIVPVEEVYPGVEGELMTNWLSELVRRYRRTLQSDRRYLLEQFRLVHLARKVVGVGSVGTRTWILLLLGRDEQDPLLLQAKEAQPSALAPFVVKTGYANDGERVVAGQHLMQATSDIFLGWDRFEDTDGVDRDFYIRQLRDWKLSVGPDQMVPVSMAAYARLCGTTLARAHARSGDRIAIAAYLGTAPAFDQAIAAFAETYADQNQRDYEALHKAAASGRVTARTGL
jgi:uncharacterized protein (DUF2252 family)